jgi:hypothetical protein
MEAGAESVKRVCADGRVALFRRWPIRLDEYADAIADAIAEAIIETFSKGMDARSNI